MYFGWFAGLGGLFGICCISGMMWALWYGVRVACVGYLWLVVGRVVALRFYSFDNSSFVGLCGLILLPVAVVGGFGFGLVLVICLFSRVVLLRLGDVFG